MEERNNRSNTMLLTVIAIATLLVAVIGATFAYFTAIISGRETASTVQVTGSRLEITFADGSSELLSSDNLTPVKSTASGYAPVITKIFTLTGTNTTGQGTTEANSGMRMPYELYLMVDENTFQLQHTQGSTTLTSLTYKLVNNSATAPEGSIASSAAYASIPAKTVAAASACPLCGTTTTGQYAETYDALQTTAIGNVVLYNDAGVAQPAAPGLKLGQGYFPAGANAAEHSYTLNIYFNETGNNQNFDKGKTFTGYVAISTGNNAISKTSTAVNCGDTPTNEAC